jgi:hypothetical protein
MKPKPVIKLGYGRGATSSFPFRWVRITITVVAALWACWQIYAFRTMALGPSVRGTILFSLWAGFFGLPWLAFLGLPWRRALTGTLVVICCTVSLPEGLAIAQELCVRAKHGSTPTGTVNERRWLLPDHAIHYSGKAGWWAED